MPKRSDQRRRANKPDRSIDTAPGAVVVEVPKANGRWHAMAKRWYESLADSGQAQFYEPSDWATAQLLAEAMSRELQEKGPIRASALQAIMAGMSTLLVTEGDRRRARLELQRPRPEPEGGTADVSWLDDARRRRGAQ